MPDENKKEATLFRRIIDIGIDNDFSKTETRYLRVTNMASILGAIFMMIWMIIAIALTKTPIIYGSNGLIGVMFLLVLVFNWKGWRVLASMWFTISSHIGVLLFLYLLGYDSGVAFIYFLLIILPYMTFPGKARKLAYSFSVVAFLTLTIMVLFQSSLNAQYDVMEPYLLQAVNISITGFICLVLIWSLSILIDQSEESLMEEQQKSDDLLHNILPVNVVKDLKETGQTIPKRHPQATVLFTDFKGFTQLVSSMPAIALVKELNEIFGRFDEIVEAEGVEKIKTIGDAYMAASGIGEETTEHSIQCIRVAKQMLAYLEKRNQQNDIKWSMRVGIHSGSLVTGVIGKKKFAYDLFGDTINTASRMESTGEVGKINISGSTYNLVKHQVPCEYRGKIHAKGKGELEMYFVK